VDYQAKGSQIELREKTSWRQAVYKIKLTRKTEEVRTYYIDATTFDVLKWTAQRASKTMMPVENFLRDYRDVNGLRFPFEIDSDSRGAAGTQDHHRQNRAGPKIEESRFSKPPAATAPSAAPPSQEK